MSRPRARSSSCVRHRDPEHDDVAGVRRPACPSGERIVGIDVRPHTGEVVALTTLNRMLIVDPATGDARQVGTLARCRGRVCSVGIRLQPGGRPAAARLDGRELPLEPADVRAGRHRRLTAGAQGDSDIAFIATDTNVGDIPSVVGEAYTNNDVDGATPTTLFGIEAGNDVLVRQGAVDGNAADVAGGGSPNGGRLTTIGPTGNPGRRRCPRRRNADRAGNVAWAALHRNVDTASGLYTVSLTTGAATLVGTIQARSTRLAGLTILPGGDLPRHVGAHGGGGRRHRRRARRAARRLAGAGAGRLSHARRGRPSPAPTTRRSRACCRSRRASGRRTSPCRSRGLGGRARRVVRVRARHAGRPGGAVVDSPASVVEILDDDPAPTP